MTKKLWLFNAAIRQALQFVLTTRALLFRVCSRAPDFLRTRMNTETKGQLVQEQSSHICRQYGTPQIDGRAAEPSSLGNIPETRKWDSLHALRYVS